MQQFTFFDRVDNRVWTRVTRGAGHALLCAISHIKKRPFDRHRTVLVFIGGYMNRRGYLGAAYIEIDDQNAAHLNERNRVMVEWMKAGADDRP
jgi:hypothetical protein